eukprot:155_1
MSTLLASAPPDLKCDSKCPQYPLVIAASSGMCLKLHIIDGRGNSGIDVPLKNLLVGEKGQDKNETFRASYGSLRIIALAALFRDDIPQYAIDNFDTLFSCFSGKDRHIVKNDADLTRVLEQSSSEHWMDDNDDIILHINCCFSSRYTFVEGEHFRKRATIAADNAKKKMKIWVEKASAVFNKLLSDSDDFVVVKKSHSKGSGGNNMDNGDNADPLEWATRLVHLMFDPNSGMLRNPNPKAKQISPKKVKKNDNLATTEDMLEVAIEGFTMASDIVAEALLRQEQLLRDFFNPKKKNPKCPSPPLSVSSISSKASIESVNVSDEEDCDLDRGVEIEFATESDKDQLTSDEWKIFFTSSNEEESEDVVILDIPCDQDVISISSEEFVQCEEDDVSMASSNDSWALLDEE